MPVFVRLATCFAGLAFLDVALTLFAVGSHGLVEANPLLVDADGALQVWRLLMLNPAAALLLALIGAWLAAGIPAKRVLEAQTDWAVFRSAIVQPGRAANPPHRRMQLLICLFLSLALLSFPVFNNAVQLALPAGMLGEPRNLMIYSGSAGLALMGAQFGSRPLLVWAMRPALNAAA